MTALKDAGVEVRAINYIVDPPSREKLAELVRKMNASPRDLLRTTDAEYRELGLSDKNISDDEILDAMVAHPGLIQRPILEYGGKAALARPASRLDEIIREWGVVA
jgi:arsenate reductase